MGGTLVGLFDQNACLMIRMRCHVRFSFLQPQPGWQAEKRILSHICEACCAFTLRSWTLNNTLRTVAAFHDYIHRVLTSQVPLEDLWLKISAFFPNLYVDLEFTSGVLKAALFWGCIRLGYLPLARLAHPTEHSPSHSSTSCQRHPIVIYSGPLTQLRSLLRLK